jgi:H+/Cl- antiporter ClcA
LAASRFRSLRRSRWLTLRLWRQRLVFWGGAIAIGCVSVAFTEAANGAQAVFAHGIARFWLLPILVTPIGFVVSVAVTRKFFPGAEGSGIPQAIAARHLIRGPDRYRLLAPKLIIGKIGATLIGLLCGASVGREGPTVQVGAIIMLQVARFGGLKNERGLILAGSAAGIAAAFNAPLAGIVFAIEEMSRSFEQRTNGLVLYAVIFAGLTSLGLVGNYTYFGIAAGTATNWQDWSMVVVCGVIGGLAGGAFGRLMLEITSLARRWTAGVPRRHLQFALACGIIVAITGILTDGATFGTGYAQARAAIEGHPISWTFGPAKFIASLATAVSGIPGGIFAPSLAVGAGLGRGLGALCGTGAFSLVAVLGMAGYFAGVVQAPLTAFVIIMEMTGNRDNVIPLMLAAVLGFGASKLVAPTPLYHALAKNFLPSKAVMPADLPVTGD